MDIFEQFLLEFKFHNGSSMICGHCGSNILGIKIAENLKHAYALGIMFECVGCNKSRLWTNSIRGPQEFIQFLDGNKPEYRRGFCNDAFCGYCFGYAQPLKNGYPYKGKRYDRYGCESCEQNQQILVDGYQKNQETDTSWIINWYKKHKAELDAAVADFYS